MALLVLITMSVAKGIMVAAPHILGLSASIPRVGHLVAHAQQVKKKLNI